MLSAGCKYGIRAALYLAVLDGDEYVPVRTISEKLGIPRHFLAKVLQQLTQSGILASLRGRGGGVTLARPAEGIALADVVRALGEEPPLHGCLLGLPACDPGTTCPLHDEWACVHDALDAVFVQTTLEDVVRRLRRAKGRVARLDGGSTRSSLAVDVGT